MQNNSHFYARLVIALTIFLALLTGRNIASRSEHFSSANKTEIPKFPFSFSSTNCSKYNDKVDLCVEAEQEGQGCVWYANCGLCATKAERTEEEYQELCKKKK